MTSDTVILALKTIFSEAGVPTILISDNGRQYCSEEFKEFSLQWSFVHKTASPYYPKGNAHGERAVGCCQGSVHQVWRRFLTWVIST